jgi:hypothetical protein
MDAIAPPKRTLLRDWGYYSLWWALILAIGNGLMYVDPSLVPFWSAKLQQVLWGAAFGLACALVFTLVQNLLNAARNKMKSWIFAIVIWIGMKLIAMFALGAL